MVAPSAAAAVASVGRLCEGLAFLCGAVDEVKLRRGLKRARKYAQDVPGER